MLEDVTLWQRTWWRVGTEKGKTPAETLKGRAISPLPFSLAENGSGWLQQVVVVVGLVVPNGLAFSLS